VSTRDLGDVVEVQVRDNGVGIPAETIRLPRTHQTAMAEAAS
jgi:signal transduction histidine kinase